MGKSWEATGGASSRSVTRLSSHRGPTPRPCSSSRGRQRPGLGMGGRAGALSAPRFRPLSAGISRSATGSAARISHSCHLAFGPKNARFVFFPPVKLGRRVGLLHLGASWCEAGGSAPDASSSFVGQGCRYLLCDPRRWCWAVLPDLPGESSVRAWAIALAADPRRTRTAAAASGVKAGSHQALPRDGRCRHPHRRWAGTFYASTFAYIDRGLTFGPAHLHFGASCPAIVGGGGTVGGPLHWASSCSRRSPENPRGAVCRGRGRGGPISCCTGADPDPGIRSARKGLMGLAFRKAAGGLGGS